ncbi:MAG: 16S rRNA (guanine(527)-N(7))-methyltransferase RsmG [Endomicrobium sp.]|jgi:16S rRNA (guanine527-N7)-methyltransferase|nr:16S rRNA (guanine(527)-N(7))-methyltransferase RsmG [Endomicrobium sp.]
MKEEIFDEFYSYVKQNILPSFTLGQCAQFKAYFCELIEWNKTFNLISFKSEEAVLYRHFADSLYAIKAFDSASFNYNQPLKIADLGTGSGMPGIPVKIALPNAKMTLVESITKKCAFLENVNQKLLLNMEILNKRAEEIGNDKLYRAQYDAVLSRAVSKLSPNLEISIPLLKVGGYFAVHKTKNSAQSKEEGLYSAQNALQCLGAKLERIIDYKLPRQDLDYCILIFKKYKDTPSQFPRKTGTPEKKPL